MNYLDGKPNKIKLKIQQVAKNDLETNVIIMECRSLFERLQDPSISYEDYKEIIASLEDTISQENAIPSSFLIAWIDFIKSPPSQSKWYIPYLISEVLKIGHNWLKRNDIQSDLALELLKGLIPYIARKVNQHYFHFEKLVNHLIKGYFRTFSQEEQEQLISSFLSVVMESKYSNYQGMDFFVESLQLSEIRPSALNITIPLVTAIVECENYITLVSCISLLKIIVADELFVSSGSNLLILIDVFLKIMVRMMIGLFE